MILDSGICSIFRKQNIASPGEMPTYDYALMANCWYGELSFETSPANPTKEHKITRTDARYRIQQNRQIADHDVVAPAYIQTLVGYDGPIYEITRAYHGTDDENGELITDLTLEVLQP